MNQPITNLTRLRALDAVSRGGGFDNGDFACTARLTMLARKSAPGERLALLDEFFPNATPRLSRLVQRSPVAAISLQSNGVGDADWSAISLAFIAGLSADGVFDALLQGGAIRVPLRSRLTASIWGILEGETREGRAKPLLRLDLNSTTTEPSKVAGKVNMTDEFLRNAGPAGEAFISNGLRRTMIAKSDRHLFNVLVPGSGQTVASSGTDAEAVLTDLNAAWALVPLGSLSRPYIIAHPTIAKQLAFMPGLDGHVAFPDVTPSGGGIGGVPLVVSDQSAVDLVRVLDASRVAADSGAITLRASDQNDEEMDDEPLHDSVTPTHAQLVSNWQNNATSLLAEREIMAVLVSANALAGVTGVQWGAP